MRALLCSRMSCSELFGAFGDAIWFASVVDVSWTLNNNDGVVNH